MDKVLQFLDSLEHLLFNLNIPMVQNVKKQASTLIQLNAISNLYMIELTLTFNKLNAISNLYMIELTLTFNKHR